MSYKYEVVYHNSCKKQRKASGLIFAECYRNAVKELENFYCGNYISTINIEIIEDSCPIYEIKEEEI